jgi:hypothetical protein
MSGILHSGSGVPAIAVQEGAIYQREDAPNGSVYVGLNGVWTLLLTTTSGGIVTLAGDVTGASTSNTVIAMHGTAGVVAMHGTEIRFDGIATVQPAANGAGTGFNARFAAGAGTGAPGGQAQVYGGTGTTPGSVQIASAAGQLNLTISATKTLSTLADFEFHKDLGADAFVRYGDGTGTGASFALNIYGRDSSDNIGGAVTIRSGAGSAVGQEGDVNFLTGASPVLSLIANSPNPIIQILTDTLEWDVSVVLPTYYQKQRPSDVGVPQPLRFRSQSPFAGATNHGGGNDARVAGDIQWFINASVNGADNIGHYEWYVAELPVMKLWQGHLDVYASLLNFAVDGSVDIAILDSTGSGGGFLRLLAQNGGVTPNIGGSIILQAGVPSVASGLAGGSVIAKVGDTTQSQGQFLQLGSVYLNAFCFASDLTLGDVSSLNSNYVLIGNAYNIDDVLAGNTPGAGIAIFANGGHAIIQNESGDYFQFDGTFHSGSGSGPAGLLDVTINGNPYCIEILNR